MRTFSFLLGSVLVLSLEGCSSSYKPAQSPRIAVVMEGGMYTLVRDGNSYPVGLFGGGIGDAVEGNRAAEDHARSFQTLMVAGWTTYALGLGATIGGIALAASNSHTFGESNSTQETAGAALVLGGLGALVTSIVLLTTAQPHMWDAINAYNDGVDVWRLPPPVPMVPPSKAFPPAPAAPTPAVAAPPSSAPAPSSTPESAPESAPQAPPSP